MPFNEDERITDEAAVVDGYCAAWNEPDKIRRLDILAKTVAPEIRYVDPTVNISGREALAAHIDVVLARYPGSTILRTTGIDRHHNMARFGWKKVLADGSSLAESVDVVEFASDGKMSLIVGFFGPLAAGD